MDDRDARLGELLATDRWSASEVPYNLPLASAAKRVAGLDDTTRDAVLALVDWNVVAQANRDALPKALPSGHLLSSLLPPIAQALGRATLFDTPLETFTGLVGALQLAGSQVQDAFRYVELGDEDAFDRLRSSLGWRGLGTPPLDADDAIVVRACVLLFGDREPATTANAESRLATALSTPRRAGFGPARALALELGLPRSFFGQRDRRYPDPGPLLGVAQSVAPTLFAGSLERELSVVTLAAEALDRIAAVAWDARADVVDGAELVLRRAGSGVVVQGRAPMKKLGKLKGRWSLAKGDVIEAAVAFDAKGLAALLADATSGTAVAAQLVATHADASSAVKTKTLLLGGPDVVRALAPSVPDKTRGAALDGLLAKPPSLEVRESVQALLDVMETVPPKALIRAAEGGHVVVVHAMLAHAGVPDTKTRAKAAEAALAKHRYACAEALG
ncbi:MAG: hypothetical protein KC586_28810 [Myxococcales bacterium]|nr:hypothetical protein [Myxococcales bacterium]